MKKINLESFIFIFQEKIKIVFEIIQKYYNELVNILLLKCFYYILIIKYNILILIKICITNSPNPQIR